MDPSNITPHEHDVLSGRGNGSNLHTGNIRFRQLVNVAREGYVSGSLEDKRKYANCIVQHISSLNPPGRFLKKFDGKDGPWSIMSEKSAHDKTRQALREGAPAIEKAQRDKFKKVLDKQQADPLLYLSMVMTDPPSSINSLNEVNRRKSVQDALPLIHATNTSTTTSSVEMLHSHPSDATKFTSYCVHCGKNTTRSDDEDDSYAKNITLRNGTRSFAFGDMQGRGNSVSDQLLRIDNSHDGHYIIDPMQEQYDEE